MKTYNEVNKAWKELNGLKKTYGRDSEQYRKALKAYNKAFNNFTDAMIVKD